MPIGFIRELGAIPSYYLHYYYRTSAVLAHQRTGKTRAEEVMEIEAGSARALQGSRRWTRSRSSWRSVAARSTPTRPPRLIASLHADTGDVQVVNVRNDGAIPNLAADDVVEVTCTVDRAGAHPLPVDPLAPEMHGLVAHAKAYEKLTIEAAMSGSRTDALMALMANPLIPDWDTAGPAARLAARGQPSLPAALLPRGVSRAIPPAAPRRWPGSSPARRPRRGCRARRRGTSSP